MSNQREQLIRSAVQRAIGSLASDDRTVGQGGLFELAYPFVAADVPDASSEEIKSAFSVIWGMNDMTRDLYNQVLAVCARHAPRENETIAQVLERASRGGDIEARCLLALVRSAR